MSGAIAHSAQLVVANVSPRLHKAVVEPDPSLEARFVRLADEDQVSVMAAATYLAVPTNQFGIRIPVARLVEWFSELPYAMTLNKAVLVYYSITGPSVVVRTPTRDPSSSGLKPSITISEPDVEGVFRTRTTWRT